MKLTGFLFGVYNSRGGACIVIGNDRTKAIDTFLAKFCGFDEETIEDIGGREEAHENILNDEFMGSVELEAFRKPQEDEDIEESGIPLWINRADWDAWRNQPGDCGKFTVEQHTWRLNWNPERPTEGTWVSMLVDGNEENGSPDADDNDGFRLGEDACGVIVHYSE